MLAQSGDITSWKAGIYSESFQCRIEKLGLCPSLCECGMCLGEGQFITSFARNTTWVAKRNHRELSQGCPCMFTRWWRNEFSRQLPHCLTLCPLRVLRVLGGQLWGWILSFYKSVSKNALLLWRRLAPAISWFIPPHHLFLSVCLSSLVLTQINHCLKFWDGPFFQDFVNLPVNKQRKDQFIPM